ncbi:dihydrolipoamide acetyltransferase family protein [Microbacterium sp. 1.5R]|uniref:dihydrolipoamide acetyltransferase family protein n=1 Tax=Microbacterium sp. 1.5R TaxID=1916917 RepID=UPI0011A4C244|nr:dihydrolipoamide acetyltransferase family protein [Microbacterium sp. 1.5R]
MTTGGSGIRTFRLPDLGEGLTEAGLVQWLVSVGDSIVTDQPIAEVETAKSIVELPSPFAGVVAALHGAAGDTIDVGAPVLDVAAPARETQRDGGSGASTTPDAATGPGSGTSPSGETATETETGADAGRVTDAGAEPGSGAGTDTGKGTDTGASPNAETGPTAETGTSPLAGAEHRPAANAGPTGAVEHEAYRAEERAGSGNVLIGYGTSGPTHTGRRRPAAARDQPMTRAKASGAEAAATSAATGMATPPKTIAAETTGPDPTHRPVAVRSPLVRRLARDLGLDVHTIVPTGPDGAITRADVLAAAVDDAVDGIGEVVRRETRDTGSGAENVDGLAVRSRERLSPLRKAVSARLTRSRSEIPEATVWVDVDATDLWRLRADMAPAGHRAPSITAILARFVLLALGEHPILASRLSDDGSELISFDGVNLGVAVDTDRGLLVPVMPQAHALAIDELDTALRELSATARDGRIPPERLRGSTFTLNNYGGLGVDGSAAIINHPEVAILGIGRIIERPWVVDGQIMARRIAQLSLVFDHRVCDGGYAASFLRRVTELIEHPLRTFGKI